MQAQQDARPIAGSKRMLLKISDKLSLRYEKSGSGPPLVLLHTIRLSGDVGQSGGD